MNVVAGVCDFSSTVVPAVFCGILVVDDQLACQNRTRNTRSLSLIRFRNYKSHELSKGQRVCLAPFVVMDFFYRHFLQAWEIIQRRLLPSASKGKQPDPSRLAAVPHKHQEISPVEYAHDVVPDAPTYLAVSSFPFPRSDFEADHHHRSFAIRLQPRSSRFPYRCSLDATYENRFWESGLESSRLLLQLLAADRSTTDFVVGNGVTMAKLAQRELKPGMEHRFCKAATYMYPFSTEERMRLLSASMVMMFLFDGRMIFSCH